MGNKWGSERYQRHRLSGGGGVSGVRKFDQSYFIFGREGVYCVGGRKDKEEIASHFIEEKSSDC